MKYYILLMVSIISYNQSAFSQSRYFEFSSLPELLPNSGYAYQPGLAGPYTGIDNNVLIVAGGANFPDKLPWEGGIKMFYDEIFILQKNGNSEYSWTKIVERIPFASAYGGAVPTPFGLLCFGGNTSNNCISESWFINYVPNKNKVEITSGPPLPVPLTNFAFAKVDNKIFVSGGSSEITGSSTNSFFLLDLSEEKQVGWKWKTLSPWDGQPRSFAVGAAQSNGETNCYYLFSGRNVKNNGEIDILYDAHVYNPTLKKWSVISDGSNFEFPVMAGTAFSLGTSNIVFTSGANGELMKNQMEIEKQISELLDAKNRGKDVQNELKASQTNLLNHLKNHPGFGNKIIAFNTLTHEICEIGNVPGTGQVTTTAIMWGNDIIVPSGEVRPGVRTPGILKITILKIPGN